MTVSVSPVLSRGARGIRGALPAADGKISRPRRRRIIAGAIGVNTPSKGSGAERPADWRNLLWSSVGWLECRAKGFEEGVVLLGPANSHA